MNSGPGKRGIVPKTLKEQSRLCFATRTGVMEAKYKAGDLVWLTYSPKVQESIAKAEATFIYKRARKRAEVKIVEAIVDNEKFTVHYVVSLDLSPSHKVSNVPEVDISLR